MEPRGARRDRRDRLGLAGPGSGAEFTRLARPTRSAAWSSRADASSASRSATWTGPRGGRSASRCASCTRRGTLRSSHSRRAFLHDVRWRSTTVAGRRMSERVRGPVGRPARPVHARARRGLHGRHVVHPVLRGAAGAPAVDSALRDLCERSVHALPRTAWSRRRWRCRARTDRPPPSAADAASCSGFHPCGRRTIARGVRAR